MGTHPIFESDFDCLTNCKMSDIQDQLSNLASSAGDAIQGALDQAGDLLSGNNDVACEAAKTALETAETTGIQAGIDAAQTNVDNLCSGYAQSINGHDHFPFDSANSYEIKKSSVK